MPHRALGAELRKGDTIEVWWSPRRDTILSIRPYTGSLAELAGARIATFARNTTGMTIPTEALFNVLASEGVFA